MTQRFKFISANNNNSLPSNWYLDTTIYQTEAEQIFAKAIHYVSHRNRVPAIGDFTPLSMFNNAKLLTHAKDGIHLISNVCRHRQAILAEQAGHAPHLICPLHQWRYDLAGQLKAAPLAQTCPNLHLESTSLQEWQGLLFTQHTQPIITELNQSQWRNYLSVDNYQFSNQQITEYAFNWKIFIEVYLEDYHIAPFHPGLRYFVNCDDLQWEFTTHHSVQKVGIQSLRKSGSAIYQNWQDTLLDFSKGLLPEFGAIWGLIYPNVMFEVYPYTLVMSVIQPLGPTRCRNIIEYYYHPDVFTHGQNFIKAQQAAYHETASEDEEICRRMFLGRQALLSQDYDEAGPYLDQYELGIPHFLNYIKCQLNHC